MSAEVLTPRSSHKRSASADLFESTSIASLARDLMDIRKTLENEYMIVKALDPAIESIDEVLDSLKYIDSFREKARNKGRKISVCLLLFSFNDLVLM